MNIPNFHIDPSNIQNPLRSGYIDYRKIAIQISIHNGDQLILDRTISDSDSFSEIQYILHQYKNHRLVIGIVDLQTGTLTVLPDIWIPDTLQTPPTKTIKTYDWTDSVVYTYIKNKEITESPNTNYIGGAIHIQPVFYQTRELGSLLIYNNVTQNISINLDAYKNKVDYFILKISDYSVVEMGRTGNGVIFQVIGSQIPDTFTQKPYYILNQKGELITTGFYTTTS